MFLCMGNIILIVINLCLMLAGVILLTLGLVLKEKVDLFDAKTQSMMTELEATMKEAGLDVEKNDKTTLYNFQIPMGDLFLAIGIILFIIPCLGILGVICKLKKLLMAWLVILIILFLFQMFMYIYIFNGSFGAFDRSVRNKFVATLKFYKGFSGTNAVSVIWNAIMASQKCCGVHDYRDFQNLMYWPPKELNATGMGTPLTPLLCCKSLDAKDMECAFKPTLSNSNGMKGCYGAIFDIVFNHPLIKAMVFMNLSFEFILIAIGVYVVYTMGGNLDNAVKSPF